MVTTTIGGSAVRLNAPDEGVRRGHARIARPSVGGRARVDGRTPPRLRPVDRSVAEPGLPRLVASPRRSDPRARVRRRRPWSYLGAPQAGGRPSAVAVP